MRLVGGEKLIDIQSNPSNVRNICILAHVDHGKTTLADSLVANNGIISSKLAGKLRYLDSRPDEQLRGITMKSSSISLYYEYHRQQFCINLIDSPGHVDFASEVSTAVRLCDGAIIVVDVVEGVCPQTRSALSISYAEGLKPILVLNKVDRLITEMKLSPLDAYMHLSQVLEQVNAVMGELFASDVMEREEKVEGRKESEERVGDKNFLTAEWQSALDEIDDSGLYFSPDQGNVLFSSATDGWGFGVKEFARIFSKKLGFSEQVLSKTLWGDYYVNSKTKRIMKGAQEKAKKPLFVQVILENIWALYETITVRKDREKVALMADRLDIKLTSRDLRHTDSKAQLRAVCSQWLPLADACLEAICEKVPAPDSLSSEKVERLLSGNFDYSTLPDETRQLKAAFLACDPSEDAPVIVFVSKMFPIEKKALPENKPKPLTPEELAERRQMARMKHAEKAKREERTEVAETDRSNSEDKSLDKCLEEKSNERKEEESSESALIAFARIYSGCLRKGSTVFVLGPKHDPREALERARAGEPMAEEKVTLKDLRPGRHVTKVTVQRLYLLMGRELEATDKVSAGNVFGIGDLEEHVLKTATLSTTVACPPFAELTSLGVPIMRVALEPKHSNDLQALINGLKLLNQADACALVHIQESGEIVLSTAGEVHLERCLEDLRSKYAKVEMNVSEPIVQFRETVVPPPKLDMVNEAIEKKIEESCFAGWTADRRCYFEVDARPLPERVTKILEKQADLIKALYYRYGKSLSEKANETEKDRTDESTRSMSERKQRELESFKSELAAAFREAGEKDTLDRIWSFGPRNCGSNVLLNETDYKQRKFWEGHRKSSDPRASYESGMVNGFQLATFAGPLCEEPMTGVCFVVKKWEIYRDSGSESNGQTQSHADGHLISTFKEVCRRAFNSRHPRLVTPMYTCSVLVNSDVLGDRTGSLLDTVHGRGIPSFWRQTRQREQSQEIHRCCPSAKRITRGFSARYARGETTDPFEEKIITIRAIFIRYNVRKRKYASFGNILDSFYESIYASSFYFSKRSTILLRSMHIDMENGTNVTFTFRSLSSQTYLFTIRFSPRTFANYFLL
ncbi:elongation factor-like GTPase 1 isoform X3 [Megachile rotundata]|uniref:elongation factor-like GTPase 1 isoform X3 n=1 Tax=Megachile rotundata TaxID=143995 RepID=UPI00061530C0|nr:PREDICTED: elongation factor Tu GTP-binding domain-containing protein 1 isoform X4 [Megachile rotundata]XP_012140504.1 PREDICTED: elongation factor Tu GTP-binding domain-containing protein 1 isoform X5 [Megachile rotundata]